MDAQDKVLKQIKIRINEYIHGDIELKGGDASQFMAQPNRVFSAESHAEGINNSQVLLGYYVLLQKNISPGTIVLVSNNLEIYFWQLFAEIKKFTPWIDKNTDAMYTLARWVVAKTYWQQRFHNSLDIKRQLGNTAAFNSLDQLSSEKEHALSVAYAYKLLQQLYANNVYPSLWEWFLKKAFRYASPGYKDWFAYLNDNDFWPGVFDVAGLADHAALFINAPITPTLRNWLPGNDEFAEAVNETIGNTTGEMGQLIKITDLFTAKNELYLMWLVGFKWQPVDILSFLISLPLNGFSIHIGTADGNLAQDWQSWKNVHTDWPDKPIIIDMPAGIAREDFHFLLDGSQRFFILFLLLFTSALKKDRAKDFFTASGNAKLVLISLAENGFFQDLLGYLQNQIPLPVSSTPAQEILRQAALTIQKWLDSPQNLDECYVILINSHARECERTPFRYTNKINKTHKLINSSIY